MALEVLRDRVPSDPGCDGRRGYVIHDLRITLDLAEVQDARILIHGIVMTLEIAADGA